MERLDCARTPIGGTHVAAQNRKFFDLGCQCLEEERYDVALKAIAKIQNDSIMRRSAIRNYLARLGSSLHRMNIKKPLPFGWLTEVNSDFADTVNTAIRVLGQDFFSALAEHCVGTQSATSRHITRLFLELTQDKFIWTHVMKFCLLLAEKDAGNDAMLPNYDGMYEKLANVRQFVVECPKKSAPNPLYRREQKSVRAPASHHKSPFFGTPEISLDDLTHHMLISKTCDALSKANAEPGEMIDERLLCEKLLQRRMFREAALLARHSVGCDTAMVFKGFTEWTIRMTILAEEQWEPFFNETVVFLNRLNLLPEEIIWNKDDEPAEMFVERIAMIIQKSLVNTFLECGNLEDLKTIITSFVDASVPIFRDVERLLVSPRYFQEVIWHLLSLNNAHEYVLRYVMDWASGMEGQACVATFPCFSLVGSDIVVLPHVGVSLYEALLNYAASPEFKFDMNKAAFEERLRELYKKDKILRVPDRVEIVCRKKAVYTGRNQDDRECSTE